MDLSKLTPPGGSGVLARERLLGKLDDWSDRKLIVIHAQAGQGKSTLAADHLRSRAAPAAWYTLDAEDTDPAVFLAGLGEAVRRTWPDRVPALPPLPRHRYGFGGMPQAFARWIAQLLGSVAAPAVIVLDDVHTVDGSPEIPAILQAFFDAPLPHIRFIVLSRTRPGFDLVRLRARRATAELNGRDLQFTVREVRELFGDVFRTPVTDTEAEQIRRTTEGWPAALVLLHQCLASAPEDGGKIAALTSHRGAGYRSEVFDYLSQEVFSRLPGGLQDFLLRTSVADSLTPELMQVLSGLPLEAAPRRPSVAGMVKELRDRNLVLPHDGGEEFLQYHDLFRHFLQKTLRVQYPPAEMRRLYGRAADYTLRRQDPACAVDLLLASGQLRSALGLIEEHALDLVASGRVQTLLRWTGVLPVGVQDRPWIRFVRAVSCRFTNPKTALRWYTLADKGFHVARSRTKTVHGQMLSLAGIIETSFYAGGNFRRMAQAAVKARGLLKRHPKAGPKVSARLLLALGTASFFTGRLREGADALERALALFRQQEDPFSQINCAIYLAPCSIYLGDFLRARKSVEAGFQALARIPDDKGGEAALLMARAMTALFEGSFPEAQEAIDRCHALARDHGLEAFTFLSLDIGGWLKIAQGDHRGAESRLRECRQRADSQGNAFFGASAAYLLSISHLHQGKPAEALREAEQALTVRSRSGSRLFHAVSLAALGAVHARLGRTARALRELSEARRMCERIGAVQQLANVHLVLALLERRRGRERQFLRHLEEGLRIGSERGFTYYALLSREDLRSLAAAALERNIQPSFCASFLRDAASAAAQPSLRVSCLGGFRVLRDGAPILERQWKGNKTKTLVKLLAAQDSGRLSRDAIAEHLWTGSSPDRLPARVSGLLHRTRKALEPKTRGDGDDSVIVIENNAVSLNRKRVWTDIDAFESSIRQAREARTRNDLPRSLDIFASAFELYAGDFLPGDVYDDWTATHRDRLRRTYLTSLEQAADMAQTAGEHARASGFYERLFMEDPCHEKACRWLMTRHLAEGQRSEAVRLFERCQLALRKELDIEPDEKTKRLYRSILGG